MADFEGSGFVAECLATDAAALGVGGQGEIEEGGQETCV